ncbi:MAG: ABC transporter permease [Oscillospiraceae bacterium]|nr:ABC transporter permease [Oscillospiraceae bacterium]
MKSNIWIIAKKELDRFFRDSRMVISTVLLPGLLIYIMYSFMGSALANQFDTAEDYQFTVAAVELPASVKTMLPETLYDVDTIASSDEVEACKAAIQAKELDALIVFPADFEAAVANPPSPERSAPPQVEIYYNSARTESSSAYQALYETLNQYESALANVFDVNAGGGYDLASEKDATGSIFSSMLPMLLMIFLFSGCMSVAPEAIAGEKERGTIATILVTPTKRSELAVGKIFALSIIALLSGASSTLGTMLSLPKLMGGVETMSAAYYTAADYLVLAAIILSTVLLLVALISIISAYAKTIKEAQTSIMPLMIVVIFLGVTAMFGSGAKSQLAYYCIPLYNSVQAMVGIFSFEMIPAAVALTVGVNLACTVIASFVLTRMFNSEKIMFRR